jgi:8-oxo-dGTP pyrophosphatase MutT (NUDIX family)
MILSAGIVVVRKEEKAWKYLFLRAFRNWDFPKGIVEESENALDTAIREVSEEAGIGDLKFHWGEGFKETEPYNRATKIARYYIAATSQSTVSFSINPAIGKPEHHEYRWLSYEELRVLAPARLHPIIGWAHRLITRSPMG